MEDYYKMTNAQKCPYCGRILTTGRYGNSWTCLLCNTHLCGRCTDSGICKIHHQFLTPDQIKAIQTTYRNFNISIMVGTVGIIGCFILLIALTTLLVTDTHPIYYISIISYCVLVIFAIVGLILRLRKRFTKKMRNIAQDLEI
jgi:hypothetical protein